MPFRYLYLVILSLALSLTSIVTIYFQEWQHSHKVDEAVTANAGKVYERVISSGELKVAYIVFPPYIVKDSSTGKLSGIFYNLTEELGKSLSLKINWVEEVNLNNISVGFEGSRYDMIATPLWRNGGRARVVDFSIPLFYSTVGVYVRKNDNRFDKSLEPINSPDIKIAAIDGELAGEIAKTDFPKAMVNSLPVLVDYSQLLLEVATGKSDVTFYNQLIADRYLKKNPDKLKKVGESPIRIFAECFVFPHGEFAFTAMLNSALLELIENGGLDRAFRQAGENPSEYYRRAFPYRAPN